jgi:hypothetical protein
MMRVVSGYAGPAYEKRSVKKQSGNVIPGCFFANKRDVDLPDTAFSVITERGHFQKNGVKI